MLVSQAWRLVPAHAGSSVNPWRPRTSPASREGYWKIRSFPEGDFWAWSPIVVSLALSGLLKHKVLTCTSPMHLMLGASHSDLTAETFR